MSSWGSGLSEKVSIFFDGLTIIDKLKQSVYGKIKATFAELFAKEDANSYKLPRVVVIGNESTGKSSVLERIIKCQLFPKHNKLCTKCPLRLVVENGPSKYVVKYNNPGIGYNNIEKEFDDKYKIYHFVNEIMNKLDLDSISKEEIIINIRDEDMPNFEFIDLPGIRTYPEMAAKTTQELCRLYLEDKNSIVICVVPSTMTRLTSCQSIGMIRELGMEQNCILALTMVDRLQPQDIEDLLVKRIIGQSDEVLNLNFAGYVAVVNRIHTNTVTLTENDKSEDMWFQKNILELVPTEYIEYKEKLANSVTLCNLLEKMDILYGKFINTEWKPKILAEIELKIKNHNECLLNMGQQKIDPNVIANILRNDIVKVRSNLLSNDFYWEGLDNFDEDDGDYNLNVEKCDQALVQSEEMINCMFNARLGVSEIVQVIDKIFVDTTQLKLNRFGTLKSEILNSLDTTYQSISTENTKATVQAYAKNYCVNCYLTGGNILTNLNQKCVDLYKLHILKKLFDNIKYTFDKSLYIEDQQWITKREDLNNKIRIATNHYEKMKLLK